MEHTSKSGPPASVQETNKKIIRWFARALEHGMAAYLVFIVCLKLSIQSLAQLPFS